MEKKKSNQEKKSKEEAKNIKEEAKEIASKVKETAKSIAEDIDKNTQNFQKEAKSTAEEFTSGAKEAYQEFTSEESNKKILAGILAIVLGALGIHKFILGYQKEGIIMLLVSLLTCGFGAAVMSIVGLIEGIIYLTKTDEDFYQTYQVNQKPWF